VDVRLIRQPIHAKAHPGVPAITDASHFADDKPRVSPQLPSGRHIRQVSGPQFQGSVDLLMRCAGVLVFKDLLAIGTSINNFLDHVDHPFSRGSIPDRQRLLAGEDQIDLVLTK